MILVCYLGDVMGTKELVLLVVALLCGCSSVPERNPLPKILSNDTRVLGRSDLRSWGDRTSQATTDWMNEPKAEVRKKYGGVMGRQHHYLLISGGGDNGAYGAGLLVGWTKSGKRPVFTVVTGISTGAITAPFAFLGQKYDGQLKEIYTTYSTKDLMKARPWWELIRSSSLADIERLRGMIARYIDETMMHAIAEEYKKGRQLIIGTTNVDAIRPVSWNITRIAASGHPDALDLIRKIILASAALPGAFPPVFFEVEANGQVYDEMHLDGGLVNQVFFYSPDLDWEHVMYKLDVKGTPDIYVIRNASLEAEWKTTDPKLVPILGRTIASLTRTQGIGDLYRLHTIAKRDGLDMKIAYIPPDFNVVSEEPFDRNYMSALFNEGYQKMLANEAWSEMAE